MGPMKSVSTYRDGELEHASYESLHTFELSAIEVYFILLHQSSPIKG